MLMNKEEFYRTVAKILGIVDYNYQPTIIRGRWRRRTPGNGTFGSCLIQYYSEDCIHFMSSDLVKTFDSSEEVFEYLRLLS